IQYLQENPVDNIDQLAQRMAEFKGEENKFLSTLSKNKKDEEQLGFFQRLKLLREQNNNNNISIIIFCRIILHNKSLNIFTTQSLANNKIYFNTNIIYYTT